MPLSTLKSWWAYEPTADAPWNFRRVVHLHRRAGFAATWSEVQRDLASGVDAAVDRFLAGKAHSTGVTDSFDELSAVIGKAAVAADNPHRLKAWWLYRLIFSADPLTERLTVMWHNHFATSNLKVGDLGAMLRQNEILRKFSRRPFGELLIHTVKDPAILIWLDADSNRKQHPNENLARELMELFSLGVGNFTEDDVKEAARSLTGWTAKQGRFRYVEAYHDDSEKSLLGRKGKFDGDDVLQTVLDDPATSRRLAWRLCDQFFGEGAIDDAMIDELAAELRARDLDIGWAVETILRSEAFFADSNIGNRALGPVEFIVGAVRALEMFEPPPSTLVLSEWTARLGQDLFYPPNVFGWPGGRDWLTTRSMIGRATFASELVNGSLRRPASPLDAKQLSQQTNSNDGRNRVLEFAANLLVPSPSDEFRQRVIESVGREKNAADHHLIAAVLASPEAQLG